MKLLIHTQYYPPEMGAPQARLSELARGLRANGFDVIVLTAMPNYPRGKLFEGYRGLRKKEQQDGIPVTRTWIYPTNKLSFLPRLLNYYSFVFSSLVLGIWGHGKLDYVLTESPPLFLGFSGYILSRLKGSKWIFNVSDLWPESAVHLGVLKGGIFLKLAEKLETFCYRQAWLVTGQSETIIDSISIRFPEVKTYHLSNGVDTHMFLPQAGQSKVRQELGADDETLIYYGGLHGLAQGLDQILYAAQKAIEGVRFILMGDGPEKESLVALAKNLQLSNVDFYNPVEKDKMPMVIASVDICLVPLKIALPGAVPSKLYEAMASAKPVIMIAEGEAAEIVEKYQAGLTVKPGDIPGIVNAISTLTNDSELREKLGQNGRQAVVENFSREKIVDQFAAKLKNF